RTALFSSFSPDSATTETSPLSLHDALPIWSGDDDLGDAGVRGREAGGELRPHASRDRGSVEQAKRRRRIQALEESARSVGDALDVRQKDQAARAEGAGERGGRRIGVAVEIAAVGPEGERRHDRKTTLRDESPERAAVGSEDAADESELDAADGRMELRLQEPALRGIDADRIRACAFELTDETGVDRAGED